LIEHRYTAAAIWSGAAAALTALGLLHAYRVEGSEIRELFIWQSVPESAQVAYRAIPIAIGYALATVVFALVAQRAKRRASEAVPLPAPAPEPAAHRSPGLAPRIETNPWK
jgi:hypothetical protein